MTQNRKVVAAVLVAAATAATYFVPISWMPLADSLCNVFLGSKCQSFLGGQPESSSAGVGPTFTSFENRRARVETTRATLVVSEDPLLVHANRRETANAMNGGTNGT